MLIAIHPLWVDSGLSLCETVLHRFQSIREAETHHPHNAQGYNYRISTNSLRTNEMGKGSFPKAMPLVADATLAPRMRHNSIRVCP